MPRNKQKFESDLKSLFESSSKDAFLSTYRLRTDGIETADQLAKRMAAEFANVLTSKLFPRFSNIIDQYITDQTFDITKLRAPNGPCSGIIKSK